VVLWGEGRGRAAQFVVDKGWFDGLRACQCAVECVEGVEGVLGTAHSRSGGSVVVVGGRLSSSFGRIGVDHVNYVHAWGDSDERGKGAGRNLIDGLTITDDKISVNTTETEPSKPMPMTPTNSTIFAPFHMPDHGAMQFDTFQH
jgi:hypothetical protein